MYGETWLDIIVLEHGSREIYTSTKDEDEAMKILKMLLSEGKAAYISKNAVTYTKIERDVIDPNNNYISYTKEW